MLSKISVTTTSTSGILNVTAKGSDPTEAVKIATGVSAALKDFVEKHKELYELVREGLL